MPCAVACGIFISVWAKMKRALWDSPVLGTNYQRLARRVAYERGQRTFEGSAKYWDSRYSDGGTSGPGSAGRLGGIVAPINQSSVATNEVPGGKDRVPKRGDLGLPST